jgi:transcription initiation factor TFIID subunit 8
MHCVRPLQADSLMLYVNEADETPFPRALPSFPICRRPRNVAPSFHDQGELPPQEHIPDWLPALPDQHTYVATPAYDARPADPRQDKLKMGKERRQAQKALMSLHKRAQDESKSPRCSHVGSA